MNRINLYLFSQIVKSCTLIFFIFVSIAWLMQLSRLFSIMNKLHIDFLNILGLSMWLIPNLINVTLPFIIIFGLVLAFIKFDKDKEIIAIYSLGLSIKELIKPLYLLIFFSITGYLFLNFFFSPITYSIYKEKEFTLRNNIEIEKINISNFIEIDDNLILDFKKIDNNYNDILINFKDEDNNLIFAKRGIIEDINNKLIFTLFEGFKLIIKNEEIEKLKFDNYKIEFPNISKNEYSNFDSNTINFFELINNQTKKNIKIFNQKIFDVVIIFSIILFFYLNIIKRNNYSLKSLFIFIILCIFCLTVDNFIENFDIKNNLLIIINIINVLFIHIVINLIRIFARYV